jgi:hypothetical protein
MSTVGTLYDELITRGVGKLLSVNVANNTTYMVFGTGLEDTTYDTYWFDLDNLYCSANAHLLMILSDTGGGGPWQASYYHSDQSLFSNNSQVGWYYGSGTVGGIWPSRLILGHQNVTGNPISGRVRLYNGPDAAAYRSVLWQTNMFHSTLYESCMTGAGFYPAASGRIKGCYFQLDPANFVSGTIRMYGLRHL